MEANNSNYIKDVERYFLKITRKGLMLSGKDYNLINRWFEQSIPKETLLKAIQNAVSDKDLNKLRGIYSLEDSIEDFIKSSLPVKEESFSDISKNDELNLLVKKIDSIADNNQDEVLKSELNRIKTKIKLLTNKKNNFYIELKNIENEFYNNFFESLDVKTKSEILNIAEKKLPQESKLFDEQSKEKTLKAFRNDIISKKYKLDNLFEL